MDSFCFRFILQILSGDFPSQLLKPYLAVRSDYIFQAISRGNSIDESNITTRTVFDELIRAVKDVSPMCERTYYDQFLHPSYRYMSNRHSIPSACSFMPPVARSCCREFQRSTEQRLGELIIIIIGNEVDLATHSLDASFVAGLLGDSANLVEQDGFGHVSFGQASNCTMHIIWNFSVNGVRLRVTARSATPILMTPLGGKSLGPRL